MNSQITYEYWCSAILELLAVLSFECFSPKLSMIGLDISEKERRNIRDIARPLYLKYGNELGVFENSDVALFKTPNQASENVTPEYSEQDALRLIEEISNHHQLDNNLTRVFSLWAKNFVKLRARIANALSRCYRVVRSFGHDEWGVNIRVTKPEIITCLELLPKELQEKLLEMNDRLSCCWNLAWSYANEVRKNPMDTWDSCHIIIYDSDREFPEEKDEEIPTPAVYPLGVFANILIDENFFFELKNTLNNFFFSEKMDFQLFTDCASRHLFDDTISYRQLFAAL